MYQGGGAIPPPFFLGQDMSTPSISVKAVTERLTRTTRMLRKPKHTWQVRHQPFVIQPICIAPVLTGETLVDGVYQARAVSDPVNNPLIGWWVEYYWFYVKLRDLAARDVVTEIMLDPSATLTSLHSAAKVSTYHTANTIDWAELCRQVVTQEYFREEGEAWNVSAGMLNGDPMMKAVPANSSWLDSAMRDADTGSVDDLQHPYDDPVLTQYQAAYDRMRKMQMIDMTFDEWLGTFGVSVRQDEQQHIPELLRYYRSWTYPANTVDPATGAPTSAMSWAVADTLRKDRFFREPGFICGYSVARPKFYLGNQTMAAVNMLDDAAAWLPPACVNRAGPRSGRLRVRHRDRFRVRARARQTTIGSICETFGSTEISSSTTRWTMRPVGSLCPLFRFRSSMQLTQCSRPCLRRRLLRSWSVRMVSSTSTLRLTPRRRRILLDMKRGPLGPLFFSSVSSHQDQW